jgi:hypothetical protein
MNRTHWKNIITQEQTHIQPWALPQTTWPWVPNLPSLAGEFDPVYLDEIEDVALMDRTDIKFILSIPQLLNTLGALQQDYQMLTVNGLRLNHYRTLYFDTPAFELYRLQVNRRADRYKVRSREYTDSGLSFLEVKHKNAKGRTLKDRMATVQPVTRMSLETENWLGGVFPFDSRELEPKIWNSFTRITLVSKRFCERVTLDVDLTFYRGSKVVELKNIAVAEVKMCTSNQSSPFLQQMRDQRIRARGFSKYGVGVALLYVQVKKNSLKPDLLWLNKITGGIIS